MEVKIERVYIYDPERFERAQRLYKEAVVEAILREIQKENENSQTQHLEVETDDNR